MTIALARIALQAPPVGMVGLAGHLKRHPLPDPGTISDDVLRAARETFMTLRREYGMSTPGKLLTEPDVNLKLAKGKGVRPLWSLSLAPAASSGAFNTCVRYLDCFDVCVLLSGNGRYPNTQRSRDCRTALLYRAPEAFAVLLAHEIDRAADSMEGHPWGLRANAASDIPWELAAPWLIERVAEAGGAMYDYTKAWGRQSLPGYRLTFSVDSRQDTARIADKLAAGETCTIVVPVKKGKALPTSWQGLPAIDGDQTDARCDDPAGVVVLLRAKGKLRGAVAHPLVRAL